MDFTMISVPNEQTRIMMRDTRAVCYSLVFHKLIVFQFVASLGLYLFLLLRSGFLGPVTCCNYQNSKN